MIKIDTKLAHGAIGPYSRGFTVNNLAFTSGHIPVNPEDGSIPEDIAGQAAQSCKNVKEILEATGSRQQPGTTEPVVPGCLCCFLNESF